MMDQALENWILQAYEYVKRDVERHYGETVSDEDLIAIIEELIQEKRYQEIRSRFKDKVPGHLIAFRAHVRKVMMEVADKKKLKPYPGETEEEYTARTGAAPEPRRPGRPKTPSPKVE